MKNDNCEAHGFPNVCEAHGFPNVCADGCPDCVRERLEYEAHMDMRREHSKHHKQVMKNIKGMIASILFCAAVLQAVQMGVLS